MTFITPPSKQAECHCCEVSPCSALPRLTRIILLLGICLPLWSVVTVQAAKQSDAQAFTAEGTISTAIYTRPNNPNPAYKSECRVSFSYSNGWWQIEGLFNQPEKMAGTIQNCRRVPDGVRSFYNWAKPNGDAPNTKAVTPSATAYAINFPPPESIELFVTWLALCPNAELPITAEGTMRRLLTVELLDHPKNEGRYSIKRLEPDGLFVSELVVTNNGIDFGMNEALIKRSPPFQNGYAETMYQIIETTNINGLPFPLAAIYRRFLPLPNANTSSDLFETVIARLRIDKLTGFNSQQVSKIKPPPVMVALDQRLPNLPKGVTVNYMLTNDQWRAANDPTLVALASAYCSASVEMSFLRV